MAASGRPKGLRVRTECATAEDFVGLYRDNCDESSAFVPTAKTLPEGVDCAFSLELADGTPMLRGLGVVLNAWATEDNRFGRIGLHIGFTQLTTASEGVLDQLLEKRAIADAVQKARDARQRPASMTQRHFGLPPFDPDTATESDEESVVGDVRRSITHELGAAPEVTKSAAPASELDDKSSHTVRYEGLLRGPALPAARLAPSIETAPASPAAEPDPTFVSPTFGMYAPDAEPSQTVPPLPPPPEETIPPMPARFAEASSAVPTVPADKKGLLLASWSWLCARFAALGERFPRVVDRIRAATGWLGERLAPEAATPSGRGGRIAAVFAAGVMVGLLVSVSLRGSGSSEKPAQVAVATPAECAPTPIEPPALAKVEEPEVTTDAVGAHVANEPRATTAAATSAPAPRTKSAGAKTAAIAKPATKAAVKPAAPKPAVAKPAATQPGAAKPAAIAQTARASAATKPVAPKPVAVAKPAAPKPAAATPVAPKPVAVAKPAAPKPVAVAKPAAPKPVAVAKPAAPKPVVAKPAAPKPVAVAKPAAAKPAAAVAKPAAVAQIPKPTAAAAKAPVPRATKPAAQAQPQRCASLDCI